MRINTVEVTNHCNAKCEYCPQPGMTREKGFMSMETYAKVLEKQELDFIELHNFGEPLLHPEIFKFVKMAHTWGYKTRFSTNGRLLSRGIMDKLVESGLDLLWISIRPFFYDVKRKLNFLYDEYSEKMEIVIYYVEYPEKRKPLPSHWKVTHVMPHTWSGQMKNMKFIRHNERCFNLKNRAVTVLWDGRVVNCCHDVNAIEVIGTIDDGRLEPRPFSLCKECEFYGTQ